MPHGTAIKRRYRAAMLSPTVNSMLTGICLLCTAKVQVCSPDSGCYVGCVAHERCDANTQLTWKWRFTFCCTGKLSPEAADPGAPQWSTSVLHAHGFGEARGMIQAVMNMQQRQEHLALVRDRQRHVGAALMETWLNDVLEQRAPGDNPVQLMHPRSGGDRGLQAFGISRKELHSVGLSDADIDRLHRALYVYSVGFSDMLKARPHSPIVSHACTCTACTDRMWMVRAERAHAEQQIPSACSNRQVLADRSSLAVPVILLSSRCVNCPDNDCRWNAAGLHCSQRGA